MEIEEERRGNRGIENMAQTVIGVNLNQLTQSQATPPEKPEPAPPLTPAPVTPPLTPAPVTPTASEIKAPPSMPETAPAKGGNSKLIFIVVGVVILLFILLALLIGGLYFSGILTFTR
jgi:hypothetical protein